ncbi:MAG TPA: hypothetical protein VK021_09755 [Flavobacteriaceae bacterium]|nr:hypothetical protein [Flavobacteriaceae bacterium]
MSFSELYDAGSHLRNFSHFSSLVNLAAVDGEITQKEEVLLKRFAQKLNISESQYQEAMANPNKFPTNAPATNMERLERLYDILRLIFSDSEMSSKEEALLKKYAVALGFSSKDSQEVIDRSIKIMSGQLTFGDYLYLLRRPKFEEE